jgi:hypothetical protein
MPDSLYNIRDASLDDGTINYYTLIGEPSDADSEALRAKIQALYTESQANRDHRNLNKRREYQTLLEWLPRARAVLLEPEKRARYDAYLAAAQAGGAEVEFDEFIRDLLGQGEAMDEKTGLLGVQDRVQEPRAHVIKTPVEAGAKKPAVPVAPRQPATASSGSMAPVLGALGGLIIGGAIGWFVLSSWVAALLIGAILAVVMFGALNRQPSGRIRS